MGVDDNVLIGLKDDLVTIPFSDVKSEMKKGLKKAEDRVKLFSEEKRKIHHFIVKNLPILREPISPDLISQELQIPLNSVIKIVTELEEGKTFIYRNNSENINWAYPVTVDTTPHKIYFSTGEQVNAAWAIDSIATPFVQGRLRDRETSFIIKTECSISGQPMQIEIDDHLKIKHVEEGADPHIFVPSIDLSTTKEPNIIDIFWRRSVFFWSEEHIKAHRSKNVDIMGPYFTLEQSIAITPDSQGALFGFKIV